MFCMEIKCSRARKIKSYTVTLNWQACIHHGSSFERRGELMAKNNLKLLGMYNELLAQINVYGGKGLIRTICPYSYPFILANGRMQLVRILYYYTWSDLQKPSMSQECKSSNAHFSTSGRKLSKKSNYCHIHVNLSTDLFAVAEGGERKSFISTYLVCTRSPLLRAYIRIPALRLSRHN